MSPSPRTLGFPLLLAGLAGLCAIRAPAKDLEFGITPVLGSATMHQDFDPLMGYLSQALGRKVELYVASDYGGLRGRMERGEVDIGSFSPFAYVDAKSASGYVYPRAILIERGIDPDHFFSSVFFAGDHLRVIRAVLDGQADGGAAYDGALRIARASGVRADDLRVILQTDPIPHDAIAVRAGLDPGLADRIEAALVAINRSADGRRVIAENKKGLTGFAPATDATFDVVRKVARAARL